MQAQLLYVVLGMFLSRKGGLQVGKLVLKNCVWTLLKEEKIIIINT